MDCFKGISFQNLSCHTSSLPKVDLPVTASEVMPPQISPCGLPPPLTITQGFSQGFSLTHTSLKGKVRNFDLVGMF